MSADTFRPPVRLSLILYWISADTFLCVVLICFVQIRSVCRQVGRRYIFCRWYFLSPVHFVAHTFCPRYILSLIRFVPGAFCRWYVLLPIHIVCVPICFVDLLIFWQMCANLWTPNVERSSFYFILKIWPASIWRRKIKVYLINFSLSCSCPKVEVFKSKF